MNKTTPVKSENRKYLGPEVISSHEKLFSVFLDKYMYSTRNVNLYMINDRIGYTHDRIG